MLTQFSNLIAQHAQQEYGLGLALTICAVLLGVILISIPRPRRKTLHIEPKTPKKRKKKKRR